MSILEKGQSMGKKTNPYALKRSYLEELKQKAQEEYKQKFLDDVEKLKKERESNGKTQDVRK